jgi:hypothetical protein
MSGLLKPIVRLLPLALLIAWALSSCKKDALLTGSGYKLDFSQNTLLFDTVFTTAGSTVQAFEVLNKHSQPINISSVKLAGGAASPYKINIDGTPGTSFSNIQIPANDSIYVFVTVTVNPGKINTPFLVEDSVMFTTNGNLQSVYLEAYGQNAIFIKPTVFPPTGPAFSLIPCSAVWTSALPVVISGYAVVNTGCTLTIDPGTKIYMHNNATLYVSGGATLNINGAAGSPVVFQGDRLDAAYQTIPGQWGEILLSPLSVNNTINWAVVKNGIVGIEADSNGSGYLAPTLNISHTIIKSMSEFGLLGQDSYITGDDLLIEDCQYYCVNLNIGGNYRFNQCTFANYWSYTQRQTALLNINNYYFDNSNNLHIRSMDSAIFCNCIVYGSQVNEVNLDTKGGTFGYAFYNCELKTNIGSNPNFNAKTQGLVNQDPLFSNAAEPPADDYHVNGSISPALLQGSAAYGNYPNDLDGSARVYPSTLGAYQR